MKVVSIDKVEKVKVEMEGAEKAYKQIPISKEDGAPLFSFRVFTLEADGYTPFHTHPFEHVNYVIEGQGAIVKENGEEIEFKKGDFAIILPDEKHQYRNKSAQDPFILICAVPKEYE